LIRFSIGGRLRRYQSGRKIPEHVDDFVLGESCSTRAASAAALSNTGVDPYLAPRAPALAPTAFIWNVPKLLDMVMANGKALRECILRPSRSLSDSPPGSRELRRADSWPYRFDFRSQDHPRPNSHAIDAPPAVVRGAYDHVGLLVADPFLQFDRELQLAKVLRAFRLLFSKASQSSVRR
jgi:hypothetical protein